MTKTALVIGGGAAGIVATHQLLMMGGWDVTLVESAPHLGAGVQTRWHGGHPYTMGPRHFLTQNTQAYEYAKKYIGMRNCGEHQFLTYVEADHNFYHYPIHEDDIPRMPEAEKIKAELVACAKSEIKIHNFEDFWIQAIGPTLYFKFIKKYNKKMWRIEANYIDTFHWSPKGVTLKSGPRTAWDTAISAYPSEPDGYNSWFKRATDGAKIYRSTHINGFDFIGKAVWFNKERHTYDIIISTISPDVPFSFCYDELPYMGRDFTRIVLPVEFALPPDVYFMYEAGNEAWTRITEMKKFTKHKSDQTLLMLETPSKNGKFYPLPLKVEQRKAELYYKMMAKGIYCMGRNGSYRYGVDIAACIAQGFELVIALQQGGQDHPVLGDAWRVI